MAKYMKNTGNAHVKAARFVHRYIRANLNADLTCHGSAAVLEQSHSHWNEIKATFGAAFPHGGRRLTTGVAVLLNGAAWRGRRTNRPP